MKKLICAFFFISGLGLSAQAAGQGEHAPLSYDLGGASGSYNGNSYSEIHVGLNWFVEDWVNWRNSIFTQFGSTIDSVYGLDSAVLFNKSFYTSGGGAGIEFFAGPGLRFATEKSNAIFGEAGVVLDFGGVLRIGGGVQQLHYSEDRTDKNNYSLPKDETQIFFILAGSGSF